MQLILSELQPRQLCRTLSGFELRTPQYSAMRALLALAQLTIVLATPYTALMQTVTGRGPAPYCDGIRAASAYCLGAELPHCVVTTTIAIILVAVAAGITPTVFAVLHAWVAFSIASSIALPDGGDQAAGVITLLLIAVSFGDNRRWLGDTRQLPLADHRNQIALAGLMVIRVQIATIYFNSAIAKLFAPDWTNGTAEYYVLRDPYFGASGTIAELLHNLTEIPLIAVGASWGAIVIELTIGLLILCGPRSRSIALLLCVLLHGAIILTVGLWSFGMIMIAAVGLAATPATRNQQSKTVWASLAQILSPKNQNSRPRTTVTGSNESPEPQPPATPLSHGHNE